MKKFRTFAVIVLVASGGLHLQEIRYQHAFDGSINNLSLVVPDTANAGTVLGADYGTSAANSTVRDGLLQDGACPNKLIAALALMLP